MTASSHVLSFETVKWFHGLGMRGKCRWSEYGEAAIAGRWYVVVIIEQAADVEKGHASGGEEWGGTGAYGSLFYVTPRSFQVRLVGLG